MGFLAPAAIAALGMLAAATSISSGAGSEGRETGFLDRSLTLDGETYRYQVYVPHGYSESTPWPTVLFLHGSGERGDDGMRQTQVGLPSAIRWSSELWPAIVVMPQAPADGNWQGLGGRIAMAALDQTLAEFRTDPDRVSLTGLSIGGQGTWYLAYQHPDRFAAIAPVCGFLVSDHHASFLPESLPHPEETVAAKIAGLPTWVFHGDADNVIPVDAARRLVHALEAAGADVRYTELPGVGHNAWDAAYGSAELAEWLLTQR